MKKFNPAQIVSMHVIGQFKKKAPFYIRYRRGDIRKKEIRFLGLRLRKETRYEEDIYELWCDFFSCSYKGIIDYYDGTYNFHRTFERKENDWFYRPYIVFKMSDGHEIEKIFLTEEEQQKFLDTFKDNYGLDLDNFIIY